MANSFVNKKVDLTTTSATTLYTVPSATTAVIKSILVSEDTGNADTITISLTNTSSAVFSLFKTKAIGANATVELLTAPLVVEESEIIKVTAATANRLHVVLSALEIKPRQVTTQTMAITRAQIARQLLAQGGSPGNTTFQLARKRSDGKRPGYYGPDAGEGGMESDFGAGTYSDGGDNAIDRGEAPGGSNAQFAATQAAMAQRAEAEAKAKIEKEKKQKAEAAFEKNRFNYNRPNKVKKGLMKAISFMPITSRLTGITKDYIDEEEKKAAEIENLALGNYNPGSIGSPTYGKATDAAMSNYKSTVGGFPTRDTGGGDGGDNDNYIPPVYVQPTTADTAATTKDDEEANPFTAQFTRAALTDADRARINEIGGLSIFAANGGRIGYDMGGEVMDQELQAGAPNLTIEGNQIPQQEEQASMPDIDAELYQLFMDALRKGDIPQGTTFDTYKELMMQMMSQQQGEQMQPEMQEGIMQASTMQPEREMAAYGGIMGSDGRKRYGFGSFFKKAARAIKKVAKSPIGKAALLAGGAYLLGGSSFLGGQGMFAKGQGLTRFSNLKNIMNFTKLSEAQKLKNSLPLLNTSGKVPQSLLSKGLGLVKNNKMASILGLSGLAGLYTAKTQEEEESLDDLIGRSARGPSLDPAGIRRQIAENMGNVDPNEYAYLSKASYAADGGRIGAQEGGMMNLGGNEMDLRGGGFVPLGAKEKADDVPARLSKNEFVFTADAVRAAGGGSVDKGAEKMYNTMKRLEGVTA